MKSIDRFNIGLIVICTIIYIILCIKTKYKNSMYDNNVDKQSNELTKDENRMVYLTTVYGFIYGAILISFQQRYLTQKITSLWMWIIILFVSILLVFSAFYTQIYTTENHDTFMSRFSYAIIPILPSLVILSESAISEVLEHGFKDHRELNHHMSIGGESDVNRTEEFWYTSDRSI
jgi:cadmium resistance protein CadD (predicted permease)